VAVPRAAPAPPRLIPTLWLGPDGEVWDRQGETLGPMRDSAGRAPDLFETADALMRQHGRIYLYDVQGLEHGKAQLDYISEIAREAELWVDAGIEDAGDATDIIVAGASRAVLSTARLRSAEELETAWQLTPDLLLEIRSERGALRTRGDGWGPTPASIADRARALGLPEILLDYGEGPVDWETVHQIAEAGPCWVSGGYTPEQAPQLARSGAAGAVIDYRPDRET
jgi:phosphoribosylformimino-5-aminoimidazole carboxamide ribonucleotide (ProFAR) isomerase